MFYLTGRTLVEDAKSNVPKEIFEKLSATVKDIMVNIDIETANKQIDNVNKRIKAKKQPTKF